ncbi:MAG: hypothetical protein Q9207_000457 [Kuettlingeria erythrocarpa]
MTLDDPLTGTTTTSRALSFISPTTFGSLLFSLLILILAVSFSRRVLPASSPRRTLLLHTWHAFDFLIHTIFEGAYLYHCFFSYEILPVSAPVSDFPHPASLSTSSSSQPTWLGHKDRAYGAAHSTHPTALLWQEYSHADIRWAGADPTVVSIELLTVLIAGPLAAYICFLLQKSSPSPSERARTWFLMTVLATGEIYGGFMTFAPEWLTGCGSLDTGDRMHLWAYLVFFNGLWIVLPGWVLWVAWVEMKGVFERMESVVEEGGKRRKMR